jgi:dTMP kinase
MTSSPSPSDPRSQRATMLPQPTGAGRLVAFCGSEGTGKTSHVRAAATALRRSGLSIRTVRLIPSTGRFVRTVAPLAGSIDRQTFGDLFAFERYRMVHEKVATLLERGDIVLCDRYLYTDLAFAVGHGQRTAFAEQLLQRVPVPDLTLLFDAPVETALERIRARGPRPRPIPHDEVFLRSVTDEYRRIGRRVGAVTIDTTLPLDKTIPFVVNQILAIIGDGPAATGPGSAGPTGRRRHRS